MLIKVKALTGREIDFEVSTTEKVFILKSKIEEKLAISPAQQRLLFNGRPLKDEQTFQEQHVEAGAIIHLVLQLRGGQ